MEKMFRLLIISFFLALSPDLHAQAMVKGTIQSSFGLGYGSTGLSCQDCTTDREGSLAFRAQVGYAVHPSVVLNANLSRWSKSVHESGLKTAYSIWAPALSAQWYPQGSAGLYLSGGAGLTLSRMKISESGVSIEGDAKHIGLNAGIGYEVSVSPKLNLSPYAEFLYGSGANLKLGGTGTGYNLSVNVIHFGAALSWRNR